MGVDKVAVAFPRGVAFDAFEGEAKALCHGAARRVVHGAAHGDAVEAEAVEGAVDEAGGGARDEAALFETADEPVAELGLGVVPVGGEQADESGKGALALDDKDEVQIASRRLIQRSDVGRAVLDAARGLDKWQPAPQARAIAVDGREEGGRVIET